MNAFDRWMERRGLRNVDVARACDVGEPSVWRWRQDGYWPSTRADALRIINFTHGDVTPDMLLPIPTNAEIEASHDGRIARELFEAIKAKQAAKAAKRKERSRAKRKTSAGEQPRAAAD